MKIALIKTMYSSYHWQNVIKGHFIFITHIHFGSKQQLLMEFLIGLDIPSLESNTFPSN